MERITVAVETLALMLLATTPVSAQVSKDVNVVNTPNVQIVNEPTVSLAPGAAVEIQGTPGVEVLNSPASPVPVQVVGGPGEPFQVDFPVLFGEGQFGDQVSFDVPSGKRLVVDYVSAHGNLPPGQSISRASIATRLGSVIAPHFLAISNGPQIFFTVAQPLRVHADPETTVFVNLGRDNNAGVGAGQVAVAGTLVSVAE